MVRMTFDKVPKPEQPPDLEDRYCKACRYCWERISHECMNDELRTWDPVKGWKRSSCADNRKAGGNCGPEGKFWEPRLLAPPCWPCRLFLTALVLAGLYQLVFG